MMRTAYLVLVLLLAAAVICLPTPEADKPKDGGVIINVHGGPVHHVRADPKNWEEAGGAAVDYLGRGAYGINKPRHALRSLDSRSQDNGEVKARVRKIGLNLDVGGDGGGRKVRLSRRGLDPTDVYYVDAFTWPAGPSAKSKKDSQTSRDILQARDASPGDDLDGWGADWPDGKTRRLISDAADELVNGKRAESPCKRLESLRERTAGGEGKRDASPANVDWCSDWPTRAVKTRDAFERPAAGLNRIKSRGDLGPDNTQKTDPAGWSRSLKLRGALGPDNLQSKPVRTERTVDPDLDSDEPGNESIVVHDHGPENLQTKYYSQERA